MTDQRRGRHQADIERSITLAIVALAVVTAGCLPRGVPPAGRQILADRSATLVGLLPPTGDGVLRVFITLPSANPPVPDGGATSYMNPVADLYVVSVDANGGPPTTKLLLPNIDASDELGCIFNVAPCGSIDARGVTVYTSNKLTHADALTGDVQPLQALPAFSQDRKRFFLRDPQAGTTDITLYDVDGHMTVVNDAGNAQFVGNDLFYVTSQQVLMDIPPSGVSEQVTTGLVDCATQTSPVPLPPGFPYMCNQFRGQVTPDGIALMLARSTSAPTVEQWSVRDPLTGTETVLPFDASSAEMSPYGPWILNTPSTTSSQFTFFNYRDGGLQNIDVPDDSLLIGFFNWRPGTAQAWLTGTDATWILEPGKPAVSFPGQYLYNAGPIDDSGRASVFTADGAYWFSATMLGASTPVAQVGASDDPTGPLFPLNTPTEYVGTVGQLANDRLLVPVYTKLEDVQTREDTSALDPRTGQSLPLGQLGRVAAVGQTRMMGMFHWEEMRGDLTVFDVGTGQPTVLAPEFTVTAFAEPQGADQLAPGTRIAYQFQARTDSPYDGIWVTDCP